ncbi:unnamed protein product [Cochlearia groenlandica]
MGLKRLYEAEEMQEYNAKHSRQLSSFTSLNKFYQTVTYQLYRGVIFAVDDDNLCGFSEKKNSLTWAPYADTCEPVLTGLCHEEPMSQQLRPVSPVKDVYTCLMNHPPRKQVPIGSNHQADIPECIKGETRANDRCETRVNDEIEVVELMGKCIIPMPDSNDYYGTGQGRKECLCPDKDSIRCVRRHIMEARHRLTETIGYEKFVELGLDETGEEVASFWSEEDEEEGLFHTVVYSNPVSLGRDFWSQLKRVFGSKKTMKEIVSYYFNVFILRRRAMQNRISILDVDSDDDEWRVEYNNNVESEEEEEEEDDDDEEESSRCVYMDKVSSSSSVFVEEDSCMSFELQESNNMIFSRDLIDNREECHRSFVDDCLDKNNHLLPTSNIIDEIFGHNDDAVVDDDDNLKGK